MAKRARISWSDISFLRAYREGARQAKAMEPIPDEEHFRVDNTYLEVLKNHARALIGDVAGRAGREIDSHQRTRDQAVKKYQECEEKLKQETRDRQKSQWFEGRPCLSRTVYSIVLVLMLIGELPLNSIVFRLLDTPEIMNMAFALIVGVVLLGVAHVVGGGLKYYVRTAMDWFLGGLISFVVVLALIGLAVLREHYLRKAGGSSVGETTLTYAFVVVQCMIFWGAVVAAYARHEPAAIGRLRSTRDVYVHASTMMDKARTLFRWESRAWRKGLNRRKDVYVGSNLEHRGEFVQPPLVFPLIDFDDEHVISTPKILN